MPFKNLASLLLCLFSATFCKAQQLSPLVRGNVDISVTKGTVACDLYLSNLPQVKNYVLRLNSGMNIHYFKDVQRSNKPLYYDADTKDSILSDERSNKPLYYDADTKDSILSDETKAYYVHENRGNPARYIPDELEVKYLGMYPVVRDSASGYMGQDWRGNIAFNGYSIRAEGIQGCWYPTIYDKDTHKLYTEVRYNINITCNDCSVLFVNGSKPVKARKATFVSDVPYQMSIFCGKFTTSESNNVWLLNSGMKKEQEKQLFAIANSYQAYYSKQMKIPYKGSHTFVQTTPVADTTQWAFAFYSSPTTFNVGAGQYGLASLFDKDNSARNKKTMAHELAHYYFGTLLKPDVEFGHIINEGFAEYLALTLTQHLEGQESYKSLLHDKLSSLKFFRNYKPLSQASTEADYANREYYLYYYTPILLLAIEKEIGEQAMWKWLHTMVTTPLTGHTDYNFVYSTFKTAVPDKALQDKITAKYFTSADALNNAKIELGE